MRLHDELYFEIYASGNKADVERFVDFLTSGDLDDFFEITDDYITYSDNYDYASPSEEVSITFANDDIGIEIDSFNPEKLLDVLCVAGKSLSMHGNIFDIDDEEYYFVSHKNDASYVNTDSLEFADELDEEARREESEEADDYE